VNETLSTEGGRTVLRMERRLAHPPEKVWRALTEPDQLGQWFPFPPTELELRIGGRISFRSTVPGQDTTVRGVVTELDPPRVFAFTQDARPVLEREGENLLRFELRPDGDGCLLVLTHAFHDRPYAAANAAGWAACLNALEGVVAGEAVGAPHDYVAAHEAFVEAFGLNRGSAEATGDGWRVRFDRQLMQQPVDKVWATLTGDGVAAEVGGPVPPALTTAAVPAGTLTAAAPPAMVEYEWLADGRPAGRVRWELSGDPAGTRLTLTQRGPKELHGLVDDLLAAWQAHVEQLARRLAEAGTG
jgi:uncharacterized protein YndB with AHSA1/START domain